MAGLELIGKYGGASAIILVVVVGFFKSALGKPVLDKLDKGPAAALVALSLLATLVLGLFALHQASAPPPPPPSVVTTSVVPPSGDKPGADKPAITTQGANSRVVCGTLVIVEINIAAPAIGANSRGANDTQAKPPFEIHIKDK